MNTESYMNFADVYDTLTDDVEYLRRADYVQSLINRHFSGRAELLCDLGCGTGTMCEILSRRGYDCIGIDSSPSMLNIAAGKNADGKVLYLNQDMTEFELYGTVDVIISLLDSVNYITDDGGIDSLFNLAANYLNPGGVFIFDVNTRYKFENILADNTYVYDKDGIFYTWENCYEDEYLDIYLNFFVKHSGETYRRFSEHHVQRYYSSDCLSSAAKRHGLSVLGIYGDLSQSAPKDNEERIFFVVGK